MSSKTIPQREARRLKKRVEELEGQLMHQRSCYARDWPGGLHIASFSVTSDDNRFAAIHTSRRLRHAVVAVSNDYRNFNLYALPLADPGEES